jgi:hypothetical protein
MINQGIDHDLGLLEGTDALYYQTTAVYEQCAGNVKNCTRL